MGSQRKRGVLFPQGLPTGYCAGENCSELMWIRIAPSWDPTSNRQVKGANLTKSPYLPLRSFANGHGTIWLLAAESGLGQCPGPVPSAYSFSSLQQQEPCKGNRSAQGVGRATAVVAPLDHVFNCGLSVSKQEASSATVQMSPMVWSPLPPLRRPWAFLSLAAAAVC